MAASEPTPRTRRLNLGFKLALSLGAGGLIFFTLFGTLQQRLEQKHLEALVSMSAERISDIIRLSAWQAMLHNDRESLYAMLKNVGREPGIRRLRLINETGGIRHSTDPSEIGKVIDKQAEQCYACHAQAAPLARLARRDRTRIFRGAGGQRTLGVILPIENHADCYTAACHAHSQEKRILGVIDAQLALDAVDAQLDEYRGQMLLTLAAGAGLLVAFSIFFVWGQVHRPIRELMRGTRRLAAGVLGYRLRVGSRDELGALAESFNQMAGQLEQAHADLTEWARTLEDRVTEKTAALEKANRTLLASEKMASLGRLAATVAHEVNNPLFGMLTYARLVRKELDKQDLDDGGRDRMRGHLEVIERESQRCGELMRNLLQFARQSPPQMSEIRIEQVLGRALELVRHKCALAETALEVDAGPDLPAVYGDAGQLQQVLLVLLVNASEALGKGGEIRVTVRAERKRKRLVVRVRDNGPGIPEEIQAQIFEPFFGTKDNQHRTGLGLAIARGIVERHGGVIGVASQPGAGAEFIMELPLERPGAPPAEGRAGQE